MVQKEGDVFKKLQKSERKFQKELKLIIDNRTKAEQEMKCLMNKTQSNISYPNEAFENDFDEEDMVILSIIELNVTIKIFTVCNHRMVC